MAINERMSKTSPPHGTPSVAVPTAALKQMDARNATQDSQQQLKLAGTNQQAAMGMPLTKPKATTQEVVDKWLADTKARMVSAEHRNQLEQLEEALPELVRLLDAR